MNKGGRATAARPQQQQAPAKKNAVDAPLTTKGKGVFTFTLVADGLYIEHKVSAS